MTCLGHIYVAEVEQPEVPRELPQRKIFPNARPGEKPKRLELVEFAVELGKYTKECLSCGIPITGTEPHGDEIYCGQTCADEFETRLATQKTLRDLRQENVLGIGIDLEGNLSYTTRADPVNLQSLTIPVPQSRIVGFVQRFGGNYLDKALARHKASQEKQKKRLQ